MLHLLLHCLGYLGCERRAAGDQQRLGQCIVLGLCQQIGGDEFGAGAVIGDHQYFGGAGGQVERRPGRIGGNQLFGRGHPGIAGAEDLGDLRYAGAAIGHGGDRLGAADLEHLLDAAQLRGHQHRGVGETAALRRRAKHALGAAGDAGRYRQHDDGGGQGRGARRHVQTDGGDRSDEPLATHAGLHLERQRARCAGAVKVVDVGDGGLERGHLLGRKRGARGGELGGADAEFGWLDAVEFQRATAHGSLALTAHRVDDGLRLAQRARLQRRHRARQGGVPARGIQ